MESRASMTFAKQIISFNRSLKLEISLPGIEVMNPYIEPLTRAVSESFYTTYFSDNNKRTFIFGINPGRFGAGITGVPFTDPVRLESACGIENNFQKKAELSSLFIYEMIDACGGAKNFYTNFFITAICPLGFVKENKNLNYYDDKNLTACTKQFIIESLRRQIKFGANKSKCFCLGEGENFKHFNELNNQYHFFEQIVPLPHPRWIMQYRRKTASEFVQRYLTALKS